MPKQVLVVAFDDLDDALMESVVRHAHFGFPGNPAVLWCDDEQMAKVEAIHPLPPRPCPCPSPQADAADLD